MATSSSTASPPHDPHGSMSEYSDEIPHYFPEQMVKRSAAICTNNSTNNQVVPSSRSGTACYVHGGKAVSRYRQEDAYVPKPGKSTNFPFSRGEGLSSESPCWAPLESFDISMSHDRASQSDSEEKSQAQVLPAFFHLESTNFMAKSTVGVLSLSMLQNALVKTFESINVDVVDFVACQSMYKCSYHQGNRFISFLVRVLESPTKSSGKLLDTDAFVAQNIEDGFLVEVKLQQGDRLHFSSLFGDMLLNFKESQDDISLIGTLRYKPRPFPEKGEGLALERITKFEKTSRLGRNRPEECANELPSLVSRQSLDEDMMEDVFKLVEALESDFLDVQADAATAIAGITSDAEFREQLADPKAKEAANALCRASARLLAETGYRPARRQAAVIVANLASSPTLCRFFIESDPPLTSLKRGIVDSLVTLAMLRSKEDKEEEIGTRRECMRALIKLAESKSTRNMPAMKSLLSTTPSGRGTECKKLVQMLRTCKEVLTRPATLA